MDSLANPAAAATTTTSFNRHYLNRTSSATISTHTTLITPQPHKSRRRTSSSSFALTNPTTSPLLLSKSKFEPLNPRRSSSQLLSSSSSSSSVHRRAATGYAAALLEAAQFNGALVVAALERDVRRLSKVLARKDVKGLMEDGSVGEREKGQFLKAVVDVGRFRGELKAVVNLLVDKGNLGIVWEALDEFRRIYGELKFAS